MPAFSPWHILPLFVATAHAVGGLFPFWDPVWAIREFGLPQRIAVSQPAHQAFVINGSRSTIIGVIIWVLYLQDNLGAVDMIMSLMIYAGAVDCYICWQEGVKGMGIFRGMSGLVIGGWGLLGLSQR